MLCEELSGRDVEPTPPARLPAVELPVEAAEVAGVEDTLGEEVEA